MKTKLLSTTMSLLGMAALTNSVQAGSATFDFNTDPSGILTLFGNSTWRPSGGVGGTGYLSITDAANSQSGTIVFDDLDNGGIVNSFTFSCDLRTGGGNPANPPADGYSVNFAREGDPVIATGGGFPIAPEEGTGSGISVLLDEWDSGDNDVVGISVRVDGVQVNQTALPTRNGSASDTSSLQTGPADRAPDPVTFEVADHSFVNLTVKLDPDGTLDVSYKGVPILSNFATTYTPGPGRLVFAGRTGGANSNHHVDNIAVTTAISQVPLLTSISLNASTLKAVLTDSLTVAFDPTKPYTVTIDGAAVAATASKDGTATTFKFQTTPPALFAVGEHALVVTGKDANNNALSISGKAVVGPYATLNTAWKAAPGQVDTSAETFLARVHQLSFGRYPGDANALPDPEIQIQNGYFDRAIGGNALNVALPEGQETVIAGVLNWDQDAAQQGNFGGESLIPGIPGTTNSTDNIVGEVYTWLQLPAGVTRFGVNSDDGFTLSVGASPLDFFGKVTAGVFNGGRGASDTQFEIAAPVAGLYPVRLLWWEGGGGANLEFFSVKADGTKVLVNDPNDPDSIKGYYAGLPMEPSIHAIAPYPGTTFGTNNRHAILIELVDGVRAVNDGSIVLKVDNAVVTPTLANAGNSTNISYLPTSGYWTAGEHSVSLTYANSAAVSRTETWTFLVAPFATLDTAWKAAPGQVDTSAESFLANVHQLAFGRTPGDSNLLPLPEIQIQRGYWDGIASVIAPNVAQPEGIQTVVSGVLNWDQDGAQQGNFGGETTIPGIPGTTGNTDNITGEIFTWLQLPAGPTRLGVNSDDGFTLSVGGTPMDVFNRSVAGVFSGGRGASDTTFDIEVPVAGLYPVRLLWWEGGGGANLEFFSVKQDGTKVQINDTNDAEAIKGYYAGMTAKPSITAITPYPSSMGGFKADQAHPLEIRLIDGVASVVDASIQLKVDGAVVTPTVTNANLLSTVPIYTDVKYLPSAGWTGGAHTVQLSYTDSASTARTETWTFTALDVSKTFYWSQGAGNNNILDPGNWSNGAVPPNDGQNINLLAGQRISFARNDMTIPDEGGRQINLAVGSQILSDKGGGGDLHVNARVNAAGNGPDGNGVFYVEGGGWGMPNNYVLSGDASTTANGNRLRVDGGPNRLDLNGHTLTMKGNNENNLVNTRLVGGPGSRMVLQNFTAFEATTWVDPTVTVELASGVTLSSWSGQGARRDQMMVLNNDSIIETRYDDEDLTYSGTISSTAGSSGILRANTGDGGGKGDLRLNILGALQGPGSFRKDGNGTLVLSGGAAATGSAGLNLSAAGTTVLASNNAAGSGPISLSSATLHLSNAGGQEYIDSAQRWEALDSAKKTVMDPVLSGVNSRQALGGQRRTTYTGKFNNPASSSTLYTFAEQFDDDVYLEIDGDVILSDGDWGAVTSGQTVLSPGPHDFRVSVRDGGGGSGPNDANGNGGWQHMGLGYSTTLPDDGNGGKDANKAIGNYTKIGTFYEVYQPNNRQIANAVVLAGSNLISTRYMNGFDAILTGPLSGTGNLTVDGSPSYSTDELVLNGAGSFSGATTVTTGSLLINGDFTAATGPVAVDRGGSLGGTGIIGGAMSVSGSIAPGTLGSIGTLNAAQSVTWVGSNDAWNFQLGAANASSRLAITGDFVKGPGSVFAFDFHGAGGAGTYKLVQWTGSTGFASSDFSALNLGAGSTAAFSIVGKELLLNITQTGYGSWASAAFPAGTDAAAQQPNADPDGDGITNLMEYALGTSPVGFSAAPPASTVTIGADKYLAVSWTRPVGLNDISTVGQVSTSATTWSSSPSEVTTTITNIGGGRESVVVRDAKPITAGSFRLLRVKVTQN